MDSNNKVHELIDKRWSPRAFDNKPVEKGKLLRVFEAARRAPSSSNEQPWRFIIGENKDESWKKIYSALDDFNQIWTKNAPVLIMAVAKKSLTKSGKENRHRFYDTGQSVAYLTVQATAEDLFVHQMAGFDVNRSQELFHLSEDFEAITCLALGYIGKPEILPERMQKNEYKKVIRKDLHEIAFSRWEVPFNFNV
jgi:nitroreductase